MSEFSELLSFYVKSKKIKVYSMVQYCDVDRSTMYKMVNGKRLPTSKEMVRRMSCYMELSPVEQALLMEAYDISEVGRDVYYKRKSILDFLNHFPEMYDDKLQENKRNPCVYELPENASPVYGVANINKLIYKMFHQLTQRELSMVELIIQPSYQFLFDLLKSFGAEQLHIRHLICMDNLGDTQPGKNADDNFKWLQQMLSMYQCGCSYEPYFYYDSADSHFYNLNLMPYLILTDESVLNFSADLSHGIFYTSHEILRLFKNMMAQHFLKASPVFQYHKLSSLGDLDRKRIFDFIKENVSVRAKPFVLPFLKKENTKYYSTFTKRGLFQTLETGEADLFTDCVHGIIEGTEKNFLFQQIYQAVEQDRYRLLKGNMEDVSTNLFVCMSPASGFILFKNQQGIHIFLELLEKTLICAFHDFLEQIETGNYIATKEETLLCLKEAEMYIRHIRQDKM